jgi:hypothetical protein
MLKRRGNPGWTQGIQGENSLPPGPSEFEKVVKRLKLGPEQYASSAQLREWVEKNWRQKFVPEKLLRAWHLSEWGLPEQ